MASCSQGGEEIQPKQIERVCRLWLDGQCSAGKACTFRHEYPEDERRERKQPSTMHDAILGQQGREGGGSERDAAVVTHADTSCAAILTTSPGHKDHNDPGDMALVPTSRKRSSALQLFDDALEHEYKAREDTADAGTMPSGLMDVLGTAQGGSDGVHEGGEGGSEMRRDVGKGQQTATTTALAYFAARTGGKVRFKIRLDAHIPPRSAVLENRSGGCTVKLWLLSATGIASSSPDNPYPPSPVAIVRLRGASQAGGAGKKRDGPDDMQGDEEDRVVDLVNSCSTPLKKGCAHTRCECTVACMRVCLGVCASRKTCV